MRIIAGKFGRRPLLTPKNRDIRPTSDKIRGAIFNALEAQGAVEGASALDAFCGTGALGLEALSRGAAHCTFIDAHKRSLELCRNNIDTLGIAGSCDLIAGDATRLDFKGKKFDLILLDPPYHKGYINLTLQHLLKQSAILSTARIVCESEGGAPAVQAGANGNVFETLSEKIYSDTKVSILRYDPNHPA